MNYWPLENNTLDMKGTAHLYNGVNASFTKDRFENENSAIRLTYGYYQVPAGVYFSGDFTISIWIRLNEHVSWARIIDFGNGETSNNIILASSNGVPAQPVLLIYYDTNPNTRVSAIPSLEIGNWTHVAFTFDGTTGKIYMNGTFSAQNYFSRPDQTTRIYNYVGKSNIAIDTNLNADLDDLMIFNRSLSDSEIIQLMKLSSVDNSIFSGNSTFQLSQLSSSQIISLFNSSYDLSGCIVNCSNKGECKFDSLINNFFCSCNSVYLSGYACQIDSRPCSSNPCLNNGTCLDYSDYGNYSISTLSGMNSSSFSCACNHFYKGTYCESKIDVCLNETCSSNGNCLDLNNKAKCKCFSMYSGDKCESESNELKTVRQSFR